MVVTVAVVVPATDRVDQAGRVDLADTVGDAALGTIGVLAPALVVEDLAIRQCRFLATILKIRFLPKTR